MIFGNFTKDWPESSGVLWTRVGGYPPKVETKSRCFLIRQLEVRGVCAMTSSWLLRKGVPVVASILVQGGGASIPNLD
eukprot:1394453-Amorphochlora_amoeboformis.AAC.1